MFTIKTLKPNTFINEQYRYKIGGCFSRKGNGLKTLRRWESRFLFYILFWSRNWSKNTFIPTILVQKYVFPPFWKYFIKNLKKNIKGSGCLVKGRCGVGLPCNQHFSYLFAARHYCKTLAKELSVILRSATTCPKLQFTYVRDFLFLGDQRFYCFCVD